MLGKASHVFELHIWLIIWLIACDVLIAKKIEFHWGDRWKHLGISSSDHEQCSIKYLIIKWSLFINQLIHSIAWPCLDEQFFSLGVSVVRLDSRIKFYPLLHLLITIIYLNFGCYHIATEWTFRVIVSKRKASSDNNSKCIFISWVESEPPASRGIAQSQIKVRNLRSSQAANNSSTRSICPHPAANTWTAEALEMGCSYVWSRARSLLERTKNRAAAQLAMHSPRLFRYAHH